MKREKSDPRDKGPHTPLILGYALWWTYLYSNGINGPSWLPALNADPSLSLSCRLVTYLAFACVMIVTWTIRERAVSVIARRRLIAECSIVAALSFLSLALGAFRLLPPWTMLVSAASIGASSAVPIIAYWESCTSLGPRSSCVSISLALVLGALGYLVLAGIGTAAPAIATAFCVLCPVLSLFRKAEVIDREPEKHRQPSASRQLHKLPYALLLALLVYGIAFGLILAMDTSEKSPSFLSLTLNAIFVGAVAALVLFATPRDNSFNIARVYRPILPLIGTGFIIFPFFGPEASALASGIVMAGYACSRIFAATIFADMVRRLPVTPLAAAVMACLPDAGGIAIGSLFGEILAFETHAQAQTLQYIALAAYGALTLITTLFLTDSGISTMWGFCSDSNQPHQHAPIGSSAEQSARLKATDYGLTPREQEVYLALVCGKTAPAIAEELVISKATVLTHIKNIYAKAGVHSRAELLSHVYERASDLQKASAPRNA